MSNYRHQLGVHLYQFDNFVDLMSKTSSVKSGDQLAGVASISAEKRVVAQMLLVELPLKAFLQERVIPYEKDEITRLIIDEHDVIAFLKFYHLTVGDFRN
jgi:ethanolamine ammonia-lyase large subunit